MVTWLVLLALIGFVVHLNTKLRALEDRLDGVQLRTTVDSYSWPEPAAPEIEEEPAPVAPPQPRETGQPAAALYAGTCPLDPVSEPLETKDCEEETEKRSWNLGIGFEE